MDRRTFLASSAALASLGRRAAAQATRPIVLRYVPSSNLTLLDPIWSTAYVSLCHGYAVFDSLYGMDRAGRVMPQMAEGHTVSEDGRTWTIRLRGRAALPRWLAGPRRRLRGEPGALGGAAVYRTGDRGLRRAVERFG